MKIGPARVHSGVCDASAAVFLGDGSTRFLVADDEDQQRTYLRLYDAAEDGGAITEHHLSNAMLEPDAKEPEIDLEGSAWLGNRIFWIGSHSRSKKGKYRPSRHRLFATELRENVPIVVGKPYKTLLNDIARLLDFDIDPEVSPKHGGVSIEGLSGTPDGELLIAFRSPLVKKKALVITLKNPDETIDKGAEARFGDPILLDLGGRGIRSLEYWPERGSYLIVAGPAEDDGDFKILRWSGPLSTHPESLDIDFEDFGIDDGAAEGLLIHCPTDTVYLLFDEGNRVVDGVKCKDTPTQSFRSVSISELLPAPVGRCS
jgi:hypothetical protein